MIKKRILDPARIRRIDGGFSFIPHRFLTDGFLASVEQKELLLYLFLILVSDRYGLSFYRYDSICTLLQLSVDEYITARDGLMDKDLIAFDGTVFQVLDLPPEPVGRLASTPVFNADRGKGCEAIGNIIRQSFKRIYHGG